ncbi:hypothetical protein I2F29_06085 [Acinetobacter sp. FNA3]|jgi:uncharacterized membrane protein|nr:hypothetical protein [Acinetobacter pollinis]MBF7689981.1 hypothetical protein [Acinetobacter pollinis]MBF7692971.1 hypothetical protein [Acinetobacter pollinis]MBF7697452.1 hypothetical protein [Acinetobacter pollinis]MBF7699866.1 hypothetical protein [Acinetobacter pollinis]
MSFDAQFKSDKTLTFVLYILYIAAIFSAGILAVVALIINYVKRKDVQGTIFESHFTWQIRTVWWYLLWNILGAVPLFIFLITTNGADSQDVVGPVGLMIWMAIVVIAWFWIIYRAVRGLIVLNDNRAMYS